MSKQTRFFRWYRTLPLLVLAASGLLAVLTYATPKVLLRRFIYPLEYREAILAASSRYGVDPLLVCAVIKCESGWDVRAISSAGAVGLMQVMPDTASTVAELGLVDPSYSSANLADATTNIEFGSAYLGYLQQNLGSRDAVIAAYNAGIGTVLSWLSGGITNVSDVIAYPETSVYLVRVNEAYARYQDLYDAQLNPR